MLDKKVLLDWEYKDKELRYEYNYVNRHAISNNIKSQYIDNLKQLLDEWDDIYISHIEDIARNKSSSKVKKQLQNKYNQCSKIISKIYKELIDK